MKNTINIRKPFLGCAYYPEDWEESEIPYDISMMKKAGITCARIGEFAWRKMEPRSGVFEFAWLHRVVDALRESGIAVIMGTPTATPPIWLSEAHPDVLMQWDNGTRANHGGRRHCCSNNPNYLEACDRIVEAMGKEFGDDPAIIGWQLDNEIYAWGKGCVCPHCVSVFRKRLEKKYGSIENLNKRWNLNLFSQAYDSFDQIPPAVNAWHNPHICFEWDESHYQSDIEFMHRQAEILRKHTAAPIGTDMMPVNGMDYEQMNENLDVIMFNHYNVPDNISDEVFWFDFLRTLKERPFWNTETATTWNGSTCIGQFLKPEGFCRVNSWLPVALGGEGNMYWLWRQHSAGHELVHGSVISPEGRPVHVFGEIARTAEEFEKVSDFINGTKVSSEVALLFTSLNWKLFEHQRIIDGNDYCGQVRKVHGVIRKIGVCPDVIGARHSLENYKILFAPFAMTLEDNDLAERIRKWVNEGGVLVAGPMTDIRNAIGAHYTDRAMGMLEDMLNIRLDYQIPTDGKYLKVCGNDGGEIGVCGYVECHTQFLGGESIARVCKGHSALLDKTVIGKYRYGKGEVIICGAILDEKGLETISCIALKDAGVYKYETEGSLVMIPRSGKETEGLIICETSFEEGEAVIRDNMTDLITGQKYRAGEKISVKPYDVLILRK